MLVGQSWILDKRADCLLASLGTISSRTDCLPAYFFSQFLILCFKLRLMASLRIFVKRTSYKIASLETLSTRTGCQSSPQIFVTTDYVSILGIFHFFRHKCRRGGA